MPSRKFTEADQQIAAAVGERERVEKSLPPILADDSRNLHTASLLPRGEKDRLRGFGRWSLILKHPNPLTLPSSCGERGTTVVAWAASLSSGRPLCEVRDLINFDLLHFQPRSVRTIYLPHRQRRRSKCGSVRAFSLQMESLTGCGFPHPN